MVNQELFGFLLNYILHRPERVGQTVDGTLDYHLPDDALGFIEVLKEHDL